MFAQDLTEQPLALSRSKLKYHLTAQEIGPCTDLDQSHLCATGVLHAVGPPRAGWTIPWLIAFLWGMEDVQTQDFYACGSRSVASTCTNRLTRSKSRHIGRPQYEPSCFA